MSPHETIEVTREGARATLTINRPDSMNALNQQCAGEISEAIEALGADPEVRCVLLTGAGAAFSSGADLKEPPNVADDGLPDLGERLRRLYHPTITAIREMPKPVVSAVNGPAVGVGCAIALAADLIVASESAYFLLAFVNIGLVPDGGSSAFIPAKAGFARAAEMAMLGERIPAAKALEWGLINRVVPDQEIGAAGTELADRLAKGPTLSYANTKKLLNQRIYADLPAQLEAEATAQREQGRSADFAEGVTAFLEKRPPEFTGS